MILGAFRVSGIEDSRRGLEAVKKRPEKYREMYENEPIQRLLHFPTHGSPNCANRGAKSIGRKGTGGGSIPWRLQHYIQPAGILHEKEIRLVTHVIRSEPSLVPGVPGFFPSACAEPGFEIPRSPGSPSGLRAVGTKIDRRPSFTVGRMKRRNMKPRISNCGLGGSHGASFLASELLWFRVARIFYDCRRQTCERNGDESK